MNALRPMGSTRAERRALYEDSVADTVAIVSKIRNGITLETPPQLPWYVAYTYPCQESAVIGRLMELGLEPVLPRIPQYRQRTAQPWREAMRYVPLYPCYLFVPFDVEEMAWKVALSVPGMRMFLGDRKDHPQPISAEFVAFSQAVAAARASEMHQQKPGQPEFAEGDHVKVLSGPFAGYAGIVDLSGSARVAIMLEFFNRTVRTEVMSCDLRKV